MRENEFNLNVESAKLKAYFASPNIDWIESNIEDNSTGFIQLLYPNEANKRFPIIITLDRHKGVFLEMGNMNYLVKKRANFDDYIAELVELIINDKIITCAFYSSEKRFDKKKPWKSMFWFDTNDYRNNIDNYYNYLLFISRPPHIFEKFSPFSSSIVEISDWSGKRYKKMVRKRGRIL